jgi:hypothetical protein
LNVAQAACLEGRKIIDAGVDGAVASMAGEMTMMSRLAPGMVWGAMLEPDMPYARLYFRQTLTTPGCRRQADRDSQREGQE